MHTHTLILPFVGARKKAQSQAIGWTSLVVMIICGSTYFAFAKELTHVFSPISMVLIAELLSGFFAAFSFGFIPILHEILKIKRKQILPLAAMALCTGGIAPFLVFWGLSSTSAVNAELFGRMELVFVFILSGMFLKQKITRDKMLALTMILLGAIIVSLRGFENGLLFHRGDFLIFFGVAWFATGSTILKKYLRDLHPEMLIVCRFAAAAFLFFALSPFIEHTIVEEIKSAPIDIIPAILGFGFIARFLYIFCFYEAVEHLPITKVSSFGTLSIIGAAIVAYFYLGEAIEWYHFLGGSLIIAGVLTMQLIGIHINSKRHEHHMKQHHRHHF